MTGARASLVWFVLAIRTTTTHTARMPNAPFESVDFVRDDHRHVVAVIAVCTSCQAERSLSFSDVIGGVALRCPICGARDLVKEQ